MSLIKCKDSRNTCGTPFPSTCVAYNGAFTGVLNESDFPCNVNLDDIIEKLSELLKSLQVSLSLSEEKNNLQSSDITTIKNQITTLQNKLNNLDATQISVNIDLGCLTSGASPCETSSKKYSLFSILQLFKNEICLLKT